MSLEVMWGILSPVVLLVCFISLFKIIDKIDDW